ncbi:MAG: GTP 3',8-cyclase MoaA [Desulfobacteraceae bacterium]|nr:GTP 3',8-cyclase MoaA [Desulfobacteraceae bacterium]MBC2754954.1 GTP 3',8-cyclase MoaA [Desulfobacteraceae bacterium]
MQEHQLVDPYKRHLNYLRISITDRCNLRCVYCNPRSSKQKLRHKDVLRYEEILRLARIGVSLGINKIRVTGGEPLVRKGCCDFLEHLAAIDGLKDISLTTNGVLLKQNIDKIASAGVKRLNISLDTLNPEKYQQITGHDVFKQVWEGIELALQKGFDPIKLNVVAINGVNDDELIQLAELSFKYPFHIRFIELMPIGTTSAPVANPLLIPEIKKKIQILGDLIPIQKDINDGPAKRYKFKDAMGEIGFISPVSKHFCKGCNRLRLTADGHILTCLLSDICEDIKSPLRLGLLDNDLKTVFLKAVARKPFQHPENLTLLAQPEQMVSIGG